MAEIPDELAVAIIIGILIISFIIIYPQLKDYYSPIEETPEEEAEPEPEEEIEEPVIEPEPEEDEPEEPDTNIHEEQYLRDSTYLNLSHDYGLFETKLIRIGYFTHDSQTDFRADIWVKHVGTAVEDFTTDDGVIRKIPNIKYNITSANFDGADIGPDEEREGYILFSDVPLDLKGDVSLIIGTSVGFSTIFHTTSKLPHIYEITLK